MRKLTILFVMLFLFTGTLLAQVGINTDGTLPDPSAGLDVKFTNKGLLPPRLTHAQMNTIASPANGLIVYCIDCSNSGTGALAMYISGAWYIFAPTCLGPLFPSAGIHVSAPTQITWKWNPVSDATGYKWNTINSYGTATDLGNLLTKTQTGLTCNTPYTCYVWAYNACGNSSAATLNQSTSLNPPATPAAGTHVPSPTQIVWNWNTVAGATGYKWSATNNYATATDMATATTKTETGLICNTAYSRYAWAYSACGISTPVTLTQTTSLNPPAAPVAGTHVPTPTQIAWNWNSVAGATGYKWSAINNYALATDMGNILTKTETGLTCNMPYTRFVWAYSACGVSAVTNLTQNTVACTNPSVPCAGIPTVTYGGKTYNTAQIGTQCWLRENLNFGNMVNAATAQTNNSIPEKYCMNNLESNCDIYGGLYQWAEMVQYYNGASNSASWNPVPEGYVTGLCPQGWHLANEAEWTTLTTFLGGENLAGGPMKESGTIHWSTPNTGATNSSGFTALGGGWYDGGGFDHALFYGHFWVATDNGSNARYRTINYNDILVSPGDWGKTTAHAARCIRDTCQAVPNTPAPGTHVPSQTQVVWNWNTVPGAVGYKWSTTSDYNSAVNMGPATTKTETGLICNTGYTRYVWAYSACGHSATGTLTQVTSACNNPVVPCTGIPTVTYAGKTYNTVQIGTQCWFRENLDIGTRINGVVQQSDNGVVEKYCYGDLDANCATYGGLYQWNEMMKYSPTIKQGICPFGWHIPAEEEWSAMQNFIGSADAGGKLKEAGYAHWITPNTGATNSSGFTALPGGLLYPNKVYSELTEDSYIWSSAYGFHKTLRFYHANVDTYVNDITFGFSVRCLKDTCSSYSETGVSIGASVNPVCAGTQVTFTATSVNGGTNPTYQWKVNMVNAGAGGAAYSYVPANGDLVTCVVTSNLSCVTNNPATSNAITMQVTTLGCPCPGNATVSYGSKTYNTVQIGTQCWFRENLNFGTRIDGTAEQTNNSTFEKYCYANIESNCDVYGGLYQWAEMVQYLNGATNTASWNPVPATDVQGICPPGWHIPSDAEWTQLAGFLEGPSTAGGKMKETGLVHWLDPNLATNSSGFTALGSGHREPDGQFLNLWEYTNYWSSTENSGLAAFSRALGHWAENIWTDPNYVKLQGYSVRCIKNN